MFKLIRENYSDFGPTLAAEKLRERHDIRLSIETGCNWMTSDGLWVPHARRKSRVYQPLHRRDCLGELIQIDGSHHDGFEGRAPKCCLLVFIDDATGRLMHLRFSESEIAFDYMLATREYIEQHGKPVSLYSDKHAIFRVSGPENRNTTVTQFGRVLYDPAMAHCREMLKLNPNDNQGIRHLLTGYYLELEMVDELALLLDDYSEDVRPYLQYTRALLAYRQPSPDADDIAKTAIDSNKHIPGLLSKRRLQPKSNSGYIMLGELDEAIDYINHNIKPWVKAPNAIE